MDDEGVEDEGGGARKEEDEEPNPEPQPAATSGKIETSLTPEQWQTVFAALGGAQEPAPPPPGPPMEEEKRFDNAALTWLFFGLLLLWFVAQWPLFKAFTFGWQSRPVSEYRLNGASLLSYVLAASALGVAFGSIWLAVADLKLLKPAEPPEDEVRIIVVRPQAELRFSGILPVGDPTKVLQAANAVIETGGKVVTSAGSGLAKLKPAVAGFILAGFLFFLAAQVATEEQDPVPSEAGPTTTTTVGATTSTAPGATTTSSSVP